MQLSDKVVAITNTRILNAAQAAQEQIYQALLQLNQFFYALGQRIQNHDNNLSQLPLTPAQLQEIRDSMFKWTVHLFTILRVLPDSFLCENSENQPPLPPHIEAVLSELIANYISPSQSSSLQSSSFTPQVVLRDQGISITFINNNVFEPFRCPQITNHMTVWIEILSKIAHLKSYFQGTFFSDLEIIDARSPASPSHTLIDDLQLLHYIFFFLGIKRIQIAAEIIEQR
ncbi:MAG: hypothetical protein K2X39_03305 [Silvanigrellaceae bacterium]|nr:hypothetical protein [Silvanigrellaceae bacterium]